MTGYAEADWSSARLETERLTLRPPGPEHAQELRRARQDTQVRRWAPSVGDGRPRPGLQVAALDRDTGRVLGAAALNVYEGWSVPTARLDLWTVVGARRSGYGTEVARALSSWALGRGIHRLELLAAVGNEAGQRLALAAGFRREGQVRSAVPDGRARADAVVLSRLATDPATVAPRVLPDVDELSDGVVTVRPVRPGDEEAMLDERADAESRRWATTGRLWTAQDVRLLVVGAPAAWLAGTEARFAIVDTASGTCVGSLGLRMTVPAFRIAEIGYGLRSAWRGRGVTARAVRLVADWAFAEAGIARLELGTAIGNVASQRVAERAGFQREGIARLRLPTPDGGRSDEVRFGLVPPR